jgi:hypothetical protein
MVIGTGRAVLDIVALLKAFQKHRTDLFGLALVFCR